MNFPQKKAENIKGIRICRQAKAKWQEKFDERLDPMGRRYFWMSGEFIKFDHAEDKKSLLEEIKELFLKAKYIQRIEDRLAKNINFL